MAENTNDWTDARPNRLLSGLLLVAAVYLAGRLLLPLVDGRSVVEAWRLAVGVPLLPAAAGICLWRAAAEPRDRAAWALVGLALLLYPVGTIVAELGGSDDSAPIAAHVAWLSFYACMYAAVSLLGRAAIKPFPLSFLLDGVLAAVTLAAGLALLAEGVGTVPYRLWEGALGVAYPALDLLLLGFAAWVATAGRRRHASSWCWLLSALTLLLVADLIFLAYGIAGDLTSVSLYTAGSPLAAVALAMAAWQPPPRPSPLRASAVRSVIGPIASVGLALIVVAIAFATRSAGPAGPLALAALSIAFVRGWLVYRDLDDLQAGRRFERGFQEAGIGMALIGADGRWVRLNPALAAMLGAEPEALVGRPIVEIVAPQHREKIAQIQQRLEAGGRRVPAMPLTVNGTGGEPIELSVAADMIRSDEGVPQLFAQMRDVTTERRAVRFSEATARLSRAALVEPHIEDLLPLVADQLAETLGADLVAIVLQGEEDTGRVVSAPGPVGEDLADALAETRDPLGQAITAGTVMHVDASDSRATGLPAALAGDRLRSMDLVPIEPTVGAPGAICLGHGTAGRAPGADGLLFVSVIANVLASALDRSRRESLSQHQALHDPLTGLANRALLTAHLAHAVQAGRRSGGLVGVLLLDLDRFKNINDTLGHDVGDALLCEVSARLRIQTRDSDLVARLGGDEFVVVFDRVESTREMEVFADRLIEALEAPMFIEGRELYAGASVGIVAQAAAQAAPEALLRDADVAMYRAKEQGGRRSAVFDADLRARVVRRTTTEHDLRHAVERGEMRVAYQPQIALDGRGLVGFEALVRWSRADHGLVAPARFIHVAEESGLILPLGNWVLRESCAWLGRLARDTGRTLRLSVNVSPRQITPELPGMVESALADAGLDAAQLCLEITETLLITDPGAVEILGELRSKGLTLSLDDFGTGWSSLAALQRHAVDELKLDRSMVAAIGTSPASQAIARAAVDMASALGLSVVAEGVERPDQLAVTRDLGCDLVQGFLFAPSLWPSDAADYLATGSWASLAAGQAKGGRPRAAGEAPRPAPGP